MGQFNMNGRERGSHARGVYPAYGNSKGEVRGSRHKNNSMKSGRRERPFVIHSLIAYW